MKPIKKPYEIRQMLVCGHVRDPSTGKSSCGNNGSQALIDHLKKSVKERGLKGRYVVTRSGCLDVCPEAGCIAGFQPEGDFFHVDCTVEAGESLLTRLVEW